MRQLLLLLALLPALTGAAQLRVGAVAGAEPFPAALPPTGVDPPRLLRHPAFAAGWGGLPGTRVPAAGVSGNDRRPPTAFNFAAAKPYLAFFCRLELQLEQATRFPVRFRLGEVRGWQQELSKRD